MGDPKKLVTDLLTAGGFDYDDDKVNSLISNYGSDYTKMAQDLLTAGSFEYDDDKVNQLLSQYKLNTRNTQKTVDAFGTEQTIDWGNNTVETTYNPEKVKAKAKEIASSKNKTSTEVMPGVTQTIDWENNEYTTEVVDEERRDTYLENKRAADEQKASQRATYQGGVGFPGGYNYIPQTDQDLDIATSRADRAMADYEKAVEDSKSNWWDDIKVSASDVGLANLGLIQLGRYLPFKNPLAGERQKQEVEREKKIQAAEEIKAKTIENLTEDDLKPLSFEDIYQYQATQSSNVEDATNKTLFQLKKNSDRLGVVEDYFYKKLSEEEQALALRLKQGDTSVQVDQLSPEFGKWYGSYDNLSKQKGLIKDNVDKYTGVLQFIGNQIGEFKNQNLDDDTIENNLIKSLNELKREKPEWTYEIEDAKQLVSGWDAAIVEGGWWSMLGSLGINTANKVRNSINSVGKGLKSGFFYENAISNLTKGEVDDTLKEEFGRDMRDLLAAPSSQFTAGFSSNVVEKGGLKLIVDEDGQVIDVRNKDNKKIFYPTEEQVKIIESYNPEYDGKGKQTYSGASIAYTTLQVASDMIPMIAASAVSGGSALGVAIGAGSTMYGSYYNEALQKTGDMSRASVYALVATGLTSYVESKIGKLEQKIGRSLSGTEKAAIRRSALEASEATAERGIRSYVEGRGAMTWLKDKTARLPELGNDIKGELLEEYSNFGVDAVSAAVADIPSESVRGEELEETFLITSLISGTLGGGRIIASNAQEINEMLGYAAMKKDKFEQIGENWVNSATTDKEKELRRKDFEAKRTAVAEVSDMNAYLNEQDFSDEKKDELFNLALDKAKRLYQAGASNSQKSKDKYLADAATIEKEINRVAEDLGGKPFYVPEKPAGAEAEGGAEAEVIEPSKRGFVTQDEFNSLKESGAVPADVTFEQFSELPLERQQEFRTAKLDNTKRRAEQVQALLDDDTAEREASGEGNLSSKGRQKLEEELTTLQNQIKQEEDAIQKQSTAAISVQPEPEASQGVGGQVQPEPEVTTGEGQEVEAEVKTEEEIAAQRADIEKRRREEISAISKDLNLSESIQKTVEINAKYDAELAALGQAAQATKAAEPTPTPTTTEKAAPEAAEGPKLPQFAVPLSQNERQVVQRGEEGSVNQFKLIRDSLEPVQRGKKKFPSEMEQAITSGTITADQAIEAIESAGLTVPKKIADLKKKQDAKLQETANRTLGQIQAFEVKRKDGTTVPAANYTKNPDTGKWSRVNEQGKDTTVTSQLMIQQLDAEETRLQQESQRAAEQLAKPKAEPAKVETKEEGVEKTEQKVETKPETATTKPTPEPEIAEAAPAKAEEPAPKKGGAAEQLRQAFSVFAPATEEAETTAKPEPTKAEEEKKKAEQKAAEEKAAKEAEQKRAAEEKAAKEAEQKKAEEEKRKAAEEKAAKEAEAERQKAAEEKAKEERRQKEEADNKKKEIDNKKSEIENLQKKKKEEVEKAKADDKAKRPSTGIRGIDKIKIFLNLAGAGQFNFSRDGEEITDRSKDYYDVQEGPVAKQVDTSIKFDGTPKTVIYAKDPQGNDIFYINVEDATSRPTTTSLFFKTEGLSENPKKIEEIKKVAAEYFKLNFDKEWTRFGLYKGMRAPSELKNKNKILEFENKIKEILSTEAAPETTANLDRRIKEIEDSYDKRINDAQKELQALEQRPAQAAAPAKPKAREGANGIKEIIFSIPGVKSEGFTIFGKFYNVVTNSKRAKVLVNINGTTVPFYLTTGLGGKKTGPGWFPYFGFGQDGWYNKTEDQDIIEFYEKYWGKEVADTVRAVSQELNRFYGTDPNKFTNDLNENSKFGKKEAEIEFENEVQNAVNGRLPFTPIILEDPNGWAKLTNNITTLGKAISKSLSDLRQGKIAQERVLPEQPTVSAEVAKGTVVLPNVSEGQTAADALSNFLDEAGISVEVVDSKTFKEIAQKKNFSGNADGVFLVEAGTGKIFLNKDKIEGEWGKTIVFHEGIHPVINIIRNTNPKLYNAIVQGIRVEAKKNKAVADAIAEVESSEDYQSKGEDVIEDETVVEVLARVASGKIKLSEVRPTLKERIVNMLNKIAEVLNLPKIATTSTDAQFKSFAAKLSKSLEEGGNLSDIVGVTAVEKFESKLGTQQRTIEIFDNIVTKLADLDIKIKGTKKSVTNFDVGRALKDFYKKKYKQIKIDDFSQEAINLSSDYAVDEILFAIDKFGENSGEGWYTKDFAKAIDTLSKIDPDIKNNKEVKEIATIVIAIASNSTDVLTNLTRVIYALDKYKKTGKIPTNVGVGKGASAIATGVDRYNALLEKFGGDINKLKAFMQKVGPIKDLKQELIELTGNKSFAQVKKANLATDPEWNDSEVLPASVLIFGPKIGAFYSNLSGLGGAPTIDRWCIRTIYRYRGDMMSKVLPNEIEDFKRENNLQGQSDGSVAALIEDHAKAFDSILKGKGEYADLPKKERNIRVKPYRKGSQIFAKLNNVVNEISDGLTEDIKNKAEYARNFRSFTKKVFEDAQRKIKEKIGKDLQISDIQAILWIYEKQLFGAMGVKQRPDSTYSSASNRLLGTIKSKKNTIDDFKNGSAKVDKKALVLEDGPMGDLIPYDVEDYVDGLDDQPNRLNDSAGPSIQASAGIERGVTKKLISPSNDNWSLSLTQEQVDAKLREYGARTKTENDLLLIENEKGNETQRNNKPTYSAFLKGLIDKFGAVSIDNMSILDAGAGFGMGAMAAKEEGVEKSYKTFEPFPSISDGKWQKFSGTDRPNFTSFKDVPDNSQDIVVNNAVLNVVPSDIRQTIVEDIGRVLKEGGQAYISVRGIKESALMDSLKSAQKGGGKNVYLSDSEYYVTGTQGDYQKGFAEEELKAYIQDVLGDKFTVDISKENFWKNNSSAPKVVVRKITGDTKAPVAVQASAGIKRELTPEQKQRRKELSDNLKNAAKAFFIGDKNLGIYFDPKRQGELKADQFKAMIDALSAWILEQIDERGRYTRTQFMNDMYKGKVSGVSLIIDDEGSDYLFNKLGILTGRFNRTVQRITATDSIPDDVKEAVRSGANPKEVVSDEMLTHLSEEILSEADQISDEAEAAEAYQEIFYDLVSSLKEKFSAIDGENFKPVFLYEIRAMKMLAQRLIDLGETQKSSAVLNAIANIASVNGHILRQVGLNNPDAVFIETFGKNKNRQREQILNGQVQGGDATLGKTNREAIDEISEGISNSVKEDTEQIDKLKSELEDAAAKIEKLQAEKKKLQEEAAARRDVETTTFIKESIKKGEEYKKKALDAFKKLGFMSGVNPEFLKAGMDYTMYLYYNWRGNMAKVKRDFFKTKQLKPLQSEWNNIVDSLSEEMKNADRLMAKERIAAAVQAELDKTKQAPKDAAKMTPEQLLAKSLLTKVGSMNKTAKAAKKPGKSLDKRLEDNELDIKLLNEVRQDIEAELLVVPPAKRAEMLAKIDDYLIALDNRSVKLRTAKWVKAADIRDSIRKEAKSLGKTISELIDDHFDVNERTQSLAEEFILRTGMSVDEAKPYIAEIEKQVQKYVDQVLAQKVQREYMKALGYDLEAIDAEIAKANKELKDLKDAGIKTTQDDLKQRQLEKKIKALKNKKEASVKRLAKMVESPSFNNVINALKANGLNEETVVNAFASSLGIDKIDQKTLDHFNTLVRKLQQSVFAADKEEAAKELKKFVYRIQNKSVLETILQVIESYAYGNQLSGPPTANTALVTGLRQIAKDLIITFSYALSKDFKALLVNKNRDFTNIRLFADSINAMLFDLNTFNTSTAIDVLLGKEGISLQQLEISGQRLQASISMIEKMQAEIAAIKGSDANAVAKRMKIIAAGALITQQRLARVLVVSDYVTRSLALPFAAHRSLVSTALDNLPVDNGMPLYKDIHKKVEEMMRKAEVEEAVEERELIVGKGKLNKNKYRKRIKLDFLPEHTQNIARTYADSIAATGDPTGYAGVGFKWISGAFSPNVLTGGRDISPFDSRSQKAATFGARLGMMLLKFMTIQFPRILALGAQGVKNTTPLGLIQFKLRQRPDGSYERVGVQLFKDYRYYNEEGKITEILKADPFQVAIRRSMAVIPTLLLTSLAMQMFEMSSDDEEEWGYKVELDPDSPLMITTAYDSTIENIYRAQGIAYYPHSLYMKDENGKWYRPPIIGNYKDDFWGWIFRAMGTVQEKLLYGIEQKGSEGGKYDRVTAGDALSMMFIGTSNFMGEYGLGSAIEQFSGLLGLFTEKGGGLPGVKTQTQRTVEGIPSTTASLMFPAKGFATWAQTVKGMALDENRRKGITALNKGIANTLGPADLIDRYDFDPLGIGIPFQPNAYTTMASVERGIASMFNERYGILEDSVFEERATDAHKLWVKYPDIASNIYKGTPKTIKSNEITIVEQQSKPEDSYDIMFNSANLKREAMLYHYDELNEMDKATLESKLASINTRANDYAYIERLITILEASPEMANSDLDLETLRDEITKKAKDGIGVFEDEKGDLNSYYSRKTFVDILVANGIKIKSDGRVLVNMDYEKMYKSKGLVMPSGEGGTEDDDETMMFDQWQQYEPID